VIELVQKREVQGSFWVMGDLELDLDGTMALRPKRKEVK
jgi:hypothetical protein